MEDPGQEACQHVFAINSSVEFVNRMREVFQVEKRCGSVALVADAPESPDAESNEIVTVA